MLLEAKTVKTVSVELRFKLCLGLQQHLEVEAQQEPVQLEQLGREQAQLEPPEQEPARSAVLLREQRPPVVSAQQHQHLVAPWEQRQPAEVVLLLERQERVHH